MPEALNTLWRVFPFDSSAKPGEIFSASGVPSNQGAGRFDIPHVTPVWYFGESPTHAVAEVIQGLRNQLLNKADLVRSRKPLALVRAELATPAIGKHANGVADLCNPRVLAEFNIRPDVLASSDFGATQRIAEDLYKKRLRGFRWWSSLFGDWHATILFERRLGKNQLRFGTPLPLTLETEAVIQAATRLTIRLP